MQAAGDGTNEYFNDRFSLLFKKAKPSDTVTIELLKKGQVVSTIVDNTYGQYFDGFAAQPNYVGFIVHWYLVQQAFGYGTYSLKVTRNILGETEEDETEDFIVTEWSVRKSNKTVKLEIYQQGFIEGDELDFRNLLDGGWPTYLRYEGRFGNPTGEFEETNTIDNANRINQVQSRIERKYELKMRQVPLGIWYAFLSSHALANYFRISSYNPFNDASQQFRRLEVKPSDAGNPEFYISKGTVTFTAEFTDKLDDRIKRNV